MANLADERLELSGDLLKEWQSLFKAARDIEAQSTWPIIVWKGCKCLFDEATPLVIILVSLGLKDGGMDLFWYLLISMICSIVIAWYTNREKCQNVKAKQDQEFGSFVWDTIRKSISLMCDWIVECSRGDKRSQKIRKIELHVFRTGTNEDAPIHVSREAFLELTKFFSSHLRYLREDCMIVTLRSFALAMFSVYKISDHENLSLHLCKIQDITKLLCIVYAIVKTTYIIRQFNDAQRLYVSIRQLWAVAKQPDLLTRARFPVKICRYQEINTNVTWVRWGFTVLDIVIDFLVIFSRYLAVGLSMVLGYPLASAIFYLFLLSANSFLLDCLALNPEFNNQPYGFSQNVFIDRLVGTIFYNYGYSIRKLHGVFRWKTLFALPPAIIFFFIVIYCRVDLLQVVLYPEMTTQLIPKKYSAVNASEYSSLAKTFCGFPGGEYSFMGDTREDSLSLSVYNCVQKRLQSQPMDALSFLGGVAVSVWLACVLWLVILLLEIMRTFLVEVTSFRENLEDFEVFPYLDACDWYNALKRDVTTTSIGDDAVVAYQRTVNLMKLTVINSKDFQLVWSSFTTSDNELFKANLNAAVVKAITLNSAAVEEGQNSGSAHNEIAQVLSNNPNLQLFNLFKGLFDKRLSKMTSSRMYRTSRMLNVHLRRTFDD